MLVALSFKAERLIYDHQFSSLAYALGTHKYAPEDMHRNAHSSVVRGRKNEKHKCLLTRMNDFDLFTQLKTLKQ